MALEPVLFPELVGPDFIRSSEVERVADDVLDRHGRPGGIGRLHPVRRAVVGGDIAVTYLLNTKPFDPQKDDITHDAIAKCIKAPRLWHDVTGIDVAIWVRAYFWDQFDDRQRAALLTHELLHIDIEAAEDGIKLRIRPHDLEEFSSVVRHYGDWLGDVRQFGESLRAWQTDGAPATPTAVDPTLISGATRRAARKFRDDMAESGFEVGEHAIDDQAKG